jgi:hypothetical protein
LVSKPPALVVTNKPASNWLRINPRPCRFA